MRKILVLFIAVASLAFAASAYAADINEEGAEKLKSLFQELIDYQQSFGQMADEPAGVQYDGEVTVEPSGTYYAITLPHAKVLYPGGTRLEIGMVSINAAPHSEAQQWKMAVAIPTPMVMYSEAGQEKLHVAIGSQRAAGIWHEELQNFIKLDAKYEDITVIAPQPEFTIQIPNITALYDLSIDDKGLWSGPATVTLNNINAEFENQDAGGKIDQIKLEAHMDRYNLSIVKGYKEKLQAISENIVQRDVSPNHALGIYNLLVDTMLTAGNGLDVQYEVTGVHMRRKSLVGDQDEELNIAKGVFGFGMEGFLSGKLDILTNLAMEGFELTPGPHPYETVRPSDFNIDIRLKDFPFQEISELGKSTIQSAAQNPEMAGLANISLMMKLPMLLAQAGTTLEVKDNFVAGQDFKINLDGAAKADISAMNSVTAEAKATFEGLEKLINQAQKLAEDPDQEHAAYFAKAAKKLQMIRDLAKIEKKDENTFIHVFDFIVDQAGQMTLNGQNFFEALSGAKAPLDQDMGDDGVEAQ